MDVITLGETMVLFSPNTNGYLRNVSNFSMKVAGAESNVAVGLSRLGYKVGWISRLGNDEFGKKIFNSIRGEGVNVQEVKFDENFSTGIYFKEVFNKSDIKIQYYRKNSAASKMTPNDISEEYMAQAKYLHISGITPALSNNCEETIFHIIDIAKKLGLKIIFDPNIRFKLWSKEKAKRTLLKIAIKSDIILPSLEEGKTLVDESKTDNIINCFHKLGINTVILKLGEKGAYFSSYKDKVSGFVPSFHIKEVIDPVGAGDGFAAGFISGLIENLSLPESVRLGNAVGALVTTTNGDTEGLPDKEKLLSFMAEDNDTDILR